MTISSLTNWKEIILQNHYAESLCQCTLNVHWFFMDNYTIVFMHRREPIIKDCYKYSDEVIIYINVTYITENDKLFHYNTKGKQDRSSLLSRAAKVMPVRLMQWDR